MNVVVHINGVSMTQTRSVIFETMHVHLGSHSEPSTARFSLTQGSTVPVVGQFVTIGLGTAVNAFFFGQVIRVTHRYMADWPDDPFFDVDCIDGTRLLNRRIVTAEYEDQTATDIAGDLIDSWTSDFFTTTHIQAGLPTVGSFVVINKTVGDALTDLANLIGGGWHLTKTYGVDTWDVRFYGADGEVAPFAPTAPRPLMNPLRTLHGASPTYDGSQQRTRALVETGSQASLMVDVPASSTHFPVSDSTPFSPSGGTARINGVLFTYGAVSDFGPIGPESAQTIVAADVSPGDTSVVVNDLTVFTAIDAHWFQAEQQVFYSASGDLDDIPASGYGSIAAAMTANTNIVALSALTGVSGLYLDRVKGTAVNPRAQVDSSGAQSAIAAVEGGDGIHETVITASQFPTVASGTPIGEADIDAFANPLLGGSWVTDDLNAKPGSPQVWHLSGVDGVVTIDAVDITFLTPNRRPERRCTGSTVKREGLTEALLAR